MICLIKYLYWENATDSGAKKTQLNCDECPFRDGCEERDENESFI